MSKVTYENGTTVETKVYKKRSYEELEEKVDAFERKLIDLGIPADTAEELITKDFCKILEYAIDLKFKDFLGDAYEFFMTEEEGAE